MSRLKDNIREAIDAYIFPVKFELKSFFRSHLPYDKLDTIGQDFDKVIDVLFETIEDDEYIDWDMKSVRNELSRIRKYFEEHGIETDKWRKPAA